MLSWSQLDKVPSWIRDEKHIFDQNYVGFLTIALPSLKIKDARGRPRVEWIFTLVGHIFNAYGELRYNRNSDISDMVMIEVEWVILIEREIMSHSLISVNSGQSEQ